MEPSPTSSVASLESTKSATTRSFLARSSRRLQSRKRRRSSSFAEGFRDWRDQSPVNRNRNRRLESILVNRAELTPKVVQPHRLAGGGEGFASLFAGTLTPFPQNLFNQARSRRKPGPTFAER